MYMDHALVYTEPHHADSTVHPGCSREEPMSQPGEQEPLWLQPATASPPSRAPSAPEAPSPRPRPVFSWAAAVGTVVVAILLVRTLIAYPLLPLRFSHPSVPADSSQQSTDTVSSPFIELSTISMSSPRSGWALGFQNGGDTNASFGPLLLRYSGERWVRMESPDGQQLFSIDAI